MLAAWFDLTPSAWSVVLFAAGWGCGWVLLSRPRHLPSARPRVDGPARAPVSVVVPARDEAASIANLLVPLMAQLRDGGAAVTDTLAEAVTVCVVGDDTVGSTARI